MFGTIQKIDLSDANITVQEGKSMKFGYYVLGSDYSFPLAIDNGPKKPQGGFVGQSMDYIYEWDHDMNLVVSVELMDDNNVLYALGIISLIFLKHSSASEECNAEVVNPDNLRT